MLRIQDLTYRIGDRVLFDDASIVLPANQLVGFVGRNGAGKSTLLALITGALDPEGGSIEMPRRQRVGGVAQEAPSGPQSLIETVLAADTERAALLAEAETADGARRGEIEARLTDIGAHSAPARAAKILAGLGFDTATQAGPVSALSGGWRMRVALAAVLFSEPDLLLLDEPTNYLDLEGTIWLESYLKTYPHTALIVSHDRDLLNNVVDHILHLEGGKLSLYRGGYDQFERQRAERIALVAAARTKQEAERKHLQSFVDRFRAKATKARQAQSRIKALAKLKPITLALDDATVPITFPQPEELPPPLLTMESVSAGYAPGKPVLRDLSLRVDSDDRIALLGSNGNGKSTFAKLVSGALAPEAGEILRGRKLRIGYFAQHQLDALRAHETPFQHLQPLMQDVPVARVRARLGSVGFSADKADRPVSTLSGGEKTRLLLALATVHAPQLLVLDEPTNHLDVDSREALVQALNDFEGAVLFISHDRHLIDACADRLWLVANGRIRPFDDDLDAYRRLVLTGGADSASAEKERTQPALSKADQRRAAADARERLKPLRQKVQDAERRVASLTKERERIDAELADGSLFARDPAAANEKLKRRADIVREIGIAEDAWLDANEALESADT